MGKGKLKKKKKTFGEKKPQREGLGSPKTGKGRGGDVVEKGPDGKGAIRKEGNSGGRDVLEKQEDKPKKRTNRNTEKKKKTRDFVGEGEFRVSVESRE